MFLVGCEPEDVEYESVFQRFVADEGYRTVHRNAFVCVVFRSRNDLERRVGEVAEIDLCTGLQRVASDAAEMGRRIYDDGVMGDRKLCE